MTTEASATSSPAAASPSVATPPTAPAAAPPAPAAPSTLLGGTPPAATTETPKSGETPPAAETPKAAPTGAPEKYADFTMPEGITADTTAIANFSPVLRELNLTQEQAQKLVTVYANEQQRTATEFGAKLDKPEFAVEQAGLMLAKHREAWAAQVKADADIGGTNFDANVQTAQRALARFGSPELKDLMNATGLGNHPAVLKLFVAVGKQIREDNPQYGAGTQTRKSNAEIFYGGQAAGVN